jgi:hypothetical protein
MIMNEICKERIRERLLEALKKEGLPTNTAGGLLKIVPQRLSMVKNPKLWSNVSEVYWDALQKWVNSGLSIEAYAKKSGVSENVASEENVQGDAVAIAENEFHEEAVKKQAAEKEAYREKLRALVSKPAPKEITEVPYVPSRKEVHDFLLEERAELKAQIEAIDVLLRHYTE